MSAAELLALAESAERAEGPDRELDARVDCCLRGRTGFRWIGHYYCCDQLINAGGSEVPSYTASLDAALSLVPEGAETDLFINRCGNGRAIAEISGQTSVAATPALALTAACLRARASQELQS